MRSAYAVAISDGKLDKSECTYLFEIRKALEMTHARIQGVIAHHEVFYLEVQD